MSEMDDKLPQKISLDKQTYEMFMQEIMSMKPNKRKNWKNYLTDKWGTRSRCKFRDGKIFNWSLLAKEWQEVIVTDWSNCAPMSRLGQMLKAGVPREIAFGLEIARNRG